MIRTDVLGREPLRFIDTLRAAGALMIVSATCSAAIVEEVYQVPVSIVDVAGRSIDRDIVVTVTRETTRDRSPILVLSHGRGPERETMSRARFPRLAALFVAQGYLVVVPTRIGYGPTGGPDVETRGRPCVEAEFAAGFAVAADETRQVIAWASRRADTDPARIVAIGVSYGGAATLAFAASNPPGLVAAVNFSGGSGGDKDRRPGRPCNPERVGAAYESYGRTTRVPELWLYSENDKLWGSEIPKRWFDRYRSANAPARFVEMPAVGDDGHALMTDGQDLWRAEVLRFLADPGPGSTPATR